MKSRPSLTWFKPAFFNPELPVSTAVAPTEAVKTEREQRVSINAFRDGTMRQFLKAQKPSDFTTHQDQFAAVIDRVATFAQVNANQVTPALSAASVARMKENLNDFKTHVINTDIDFFCANRATIYSEGKATLHEIDERLHMDTISLQSRMNVLQALTPGLPMCSGGVMTSLQEALQTLQLGESGLKGAAYQTKAKIVEALILDHVRANHVYGPGNEVHYVNQYFNIIASQVGLPPRKDPYVTIAKPFVRPFNIDHCKKTLNARLRPEALAMAMADDYLSKVKNAVVEKQGALDLTGPVDGKQLEKLFRICSDVQSDILDKEFGKVSMDNFLPALEDREGVPPTHQLATSPIAIAQHFLQELKKQELVNYEKTFNLSDENSPNGTLKMLGTLLWTDREGVCEEAKLADILAVSPQEMHRTLTEKEGMSREESYAILAALVQQVTKITTQDRTTSVPAAWIKELVDLYHQNGKGVCGLPEMMIRPDRTAIEAMRHSDQFKRACNRGLRNVRLTKGATVIDPRWSNLLAMLAIKQGHGAALDVMCGNMLHLNVLDQDGRSFASHAAESGHVNVLEVLEDHGVNLSDPDEGGNTPLMLATNMGHVDAVRFLCDRFDINYFNFNGMTPVMHAAYNGDVEVLGVMLDAGGNIQARNRIGLSALALAAHHGHGGAVDVLIANHANVNAKDNKGVSVLMIAINSGQNDVLNKLIAKRASVDTCDNAGDSPLILAVLKGDDSVIEILVRANAKLDATNNAGKTALMVAVESNNLSAVEALVAAGADLSIKNKDNKDAAMIAADLVHMEIFNKLVV